MHLWFISINRAVTVAHVKNIWTHIQVNKWNTHGSFRHDENVETNKSSALSAGLHCVHDVKKVRALIMSVWGLVVNYLKEIDRDVAEVHRQFQKETG